jgi:multidrug efflux system outer membrane protein
MRKTFFFEKKKQKTFATSDARCGNIHLRSKCEEKKSLFASFSSEKEDSSFNPWPAAALAALAALLTGCTLAPDYRKPAPSVADTYPDGPAYHSSGAPAATLAVSADKLAWRDFFVDPGLRRLLDIALHSNRDLRSAAIDAAQAQAQFRVQHADLFPSLSVTGVGEYEGLSNSGLVGGGNASSTAIPTGAGGGTFRYYTVNAGVTSYELDLFGRLRSLSREAFEKYLAQEENRRAVALTVIGNVATTYIGWLADQQLLKVTQDTLRTQNESLRLTQAEFDHGATTLLSLRQAQTSVASAQANLAQYARQVAQDENELVLLIGAPMPADLPHPNRLGAQTLMADLQPGVPSDLLTRRPDIMKAEHTLRADDADIGAARAAFFPQVELTGTGGLSSLKFNHLFTPGSLTWSFAPQITIPIFTWGKNRANLDISKTQRDIDLAAYDKAVQTAFHDVANALTARATYVDQARAQTQDVAAAADYYRLADMRFRAGVDTYLTALDAERTLYAAQQSLVTAQEAQLQNLVTLYQDLGGGWASGEEHQRR